MSNHDQSRVQSLFLAAFKYPTDERDAWLIEQCAGDEQLLFEVRSLLKHDSPDDDPLEKDLGEVLRDLRSLAQSESEVEHLQATSDSHVLLSRLASAAVLSDRHLRELRETVESNAETSSTEAIIESLVKSNHLTKFQAEQLLLGHESQLRLGNYLILDDLGRGGMGQVFRTRHERMKREVALKMLSPESTESKEMLQRFEREIEAIAKLTHPNIATAYDADEANGVHFLVMEYVPGLNLSLLVKEQGPRPAEEAINYVLQAARGLASAHHAGVTHRDVKPTNLILDANGVVKVLDFGLAQMQSETRDTYTKTQIQLTNTSTLLGTVDYLAPEQARNIKNADHRADIYSLGCTLHFLLTGKPVYPGKSMMEKLSAHQKQAIPSLPGPAGLNAVFQRMVAKKPINRYQSMDDVFEALLPFTDTNETTDWTGNSTLITQLKSGSVGLFRSKGRQIVLLGLAVSTIVGFVTWMIYMGGDASRAAPDSGSELITDSGNDSQNEVKRPAERDIAIVGDNERAEMDQGEIHRNKLAEMPSVLAEMYQSGSWEWTTPVNLGPAINSVQWDDTPILSNDELLLTFKSFGVSGSQLSKSQRLTRSHSWEAPERIPIEGPVNPSRGNLILNGQRIIFADGHKVGDRHIRDLYEADFRDEVWSEPRLLSISHPAYEGTPYVTHDGLTLLFSSYRPGGEGNDDLWISERSTPENVWSAPENLGDGINTEHSESGACLSDDRCVLVFSSDRPGSLGSQDLWMVLRTSPGEPWGAPFNLGATVNSDLREKDVSLSGDGLSLYFSSDRPGGEGGMDIWMSQLKRKTENPWLGEKLTSGEWEWSQPISLEPPLNGPSYDAEPDLSADGLVLTFKSYRTDGPGFWLSQRQATDQAWSDPERIEIETSFNLSFPSRSDDGQSLIFSASEKIGETYHSDLFEAKRIDGTWSIPETLPVSSPAYDAAPYVTRDGLTLVFHSFRSGGLGQRDLWISQRRSRHDHWAPAVNLGREINTEFNDCEPWLSEDRCTLIFTSDRPGTLGGEDLWMVTRPSVKSSWGAVGNLVSLNSEATDSSVTLSGNGEFLLFHSDREGGHGDTDIWTSSLVNKQVIPDSTPSNDE